MVKRAVSSLHGETKTSRPMLSAQQLLVFKKSALRCGVWFKKLSRLERGILDLTIKYVDSVKSPKLVKVLTTIIQKLQQATESVIDRLIRTIGCHLAKRISDLAVAWGNKLAKSWASDFSFARFLAIMAKNR